MTVEKQGTRVPTINDLDPAQLSQKLLREQMHLVGSPLQIWQIPLDNATAGYVKIPIAGKGFWIIAGGNVNNRLGINQRPEESDEDRTSIPTTASLHLSTPFAALWVRISTAGISAGNFLRIVIFMNDVRMMSFDATAGGGTPVSATSALPVYHATPSTTVESSAPVYLAQDGGTAAMSAAAYPVTPAADTTTQLLAVANRSIGKVTAQTAVALGISATFNGAAANVLTDSGLSGPVTTDDQVGLYWSQAIANGFANVAGTIYCEGQIVGNATWRQIFELGQSANEHAQLNVSTMMCRAVRGRWTNGIAAQVTFTFAAGVSMGAAANVTRSEAT